MTSLTSRSRPRLPRGLRSSRFGHELGHALSTRRRLLAAGLAAGAVAVALTAVRPPPPPTVRVLAAAHDLAAGTRLAAADLTTIGLPTGAVPDGALHHREAAEGRVLGAPMRRGEPLTDVRLVGPALLSGYGDGLVATPVRIADPGTARLLRPGDRVDVLAASGNREDGDDGDGEPAQPVAPDVAVVAVPRPGELPIASDGALILLATTPEQAATLAQAAVTSRLSVAIRPGRAP